MTAIGMSHLQSTERRCGQQTYSAGKPHYKMTAILSMSGEASAGARLRGPRRPIAHSALPYLPTVQTNRVPVVQPTQCADQDTSHTTPRKLGEPRRSVLLG